MIICNHPFADARFCTILVEVRESMVLSALFYLSKRKLFKAQNIWIRSWIRPSTEIGLSPARARVLVCSEILAWATVSYHPAWYHAAKSIGLWEQRAQTCRCMQKSYACIVLHYPFLLEVLFFSQAPWIPPIHALFGSAFHEKESSFLQNRNL